MLFTKSLITLLVGVIACASAAPVAKAPAGKAPAAGKFPSKKVKPHSDRAKVERYAMIPRGLERRAIPSGASAMTLYRAVTGEAIEESKGLLNQSPKSYRKVKGDFAVDGGFYMTSDKAGAEKIAADKLAFGEKAAAVITISWTPPAGLKLKRWDKVTDEWREFTEACNKGGAAPAIQTTHDWIEGPMSTKVAGKREQIDDVYQYAIPSNAFAAMSKHLKITAVEDITKG
ncbi:hypothetical protein C8J56DRAFT_980563 [Mycena floridula]|nr:hypothetical protein C8J56DRAFT_980563 [Mycena floridula]